MIVIVWALTDLVLRELFRDSGSDSVSVFCTPAPEPLLNDCLTWITVGYQWHSHGCLGSLASCILTCPHALG